MFRGSAQVGGSASASRTASSSLLRIPSNTSPNPFLRARTAMPREIRLGRAVDIRVRSEPETAHRARRRWDDGAATAPAPGNIGLEAVIARVVRGEKCPQLSSRITHRHISQISLTNTSLVLSTEVTRDEPASPLSRAPLARPTTKTAPSLGRYLRLHRRRGHPSETFDAPARRTDFLTKVVSNPTF